MPFQPIPQAASIYGPGYPRPTAPSANVITTGRFPLPVVDPPRPGVRYELTTFYLPVFVQAAPAGATVPAHCDLTAQLFLSGTLSFQADLGIDLVPFALYPPWVFGNSSANVSVNSPVPYDSGQTLEVGFQASVDADLLYLLVVLAGMVTNPTIGGYPSSGTSPVPGSIGYNIARP